MLICPGCKAILKQVPSDKRCPKCGQAIQSVGTETDGPHAATLQVTHEFEPAPTR